CHRPRHLRPPRDCRRREDLMRTPNDLPVPDGLVPAGDGTYYGTARAAHLADHEARTGSNTPWRDPGVMQPGTVVQSRPKPIAVCVPWHVAKGRTTATGHLIVEVGDDVDGPWFTTTEDDANEVARPKGGLIEVLIEEDQ